MYAGLGNLEGCEVIHVGVPGTYVPLDERDKVEELLKTINCVPIYLSPKQAHNHFQGYCKGVLWPTFHSVIDLYSTRDRMGKQNSGEKQGSIFDTDEDHEDGEGETSWRPTRSWSPMEAEDCWGDYCKTNQMFASKIVEVFNDHDIVWIHDYQLLLLPSYLQRKLNNTAKVGLFLHIPFPSSELFRSLGSREELLSAMLCAHHIGFHIYEYARHFLTCCSRMLGYKYGALRGGSLAVYLGGGRQVSITCAHASVDTPKLLNVITQQECMNEFNTILAQRQMHSLKSKMKYIIGIDEVEGLRGLTLKLLAFEKFLKMYPNWATHIKFKQVGLNIDSRPTDYRQSKAEFLALMNKINDKYKVQIIEYEELSSLDVNKRLAMLKSGDVFINTSVRSGIDALPLEYILARGSGEEGAGVQILSEFSGCARVINGALRVNPWDTKEMAEFIERALTMSGAEREARRARDLSFLENSTLLSWGSRVVADIIDAHKSSGATDALLTYGLGFSARAFGDGSKNRKKLDVVHMIEEFKQSSRRYVFIDYSNTLVETTSLDMNFKTGGSARVWHYRADGPGRRAGGGLETRDEISESNKESLRKLCEDNERTTVVIVSSDLRDELAHAVEGIPNVALIAENGYVYRLSPSDDWVTVVDSKTMSSSDISNVSAAKDEWMSIANQIMSKYVFRTNGAFVWTAPSAISFNFVLSDSELGNMQSQNLYLELKEALKDYDVDIESAKGSITARLKRVNRGGAIHALMHATQAKDDAFIACFGDDVEDEMMFKAANELKEKNDKIHLFSAKVGKARESSNTDALSSVEDEAAVADILERIAAVTSEKATKSNASSGSSNLISRSEQQDDEDNLGIGLMTKETWRKSQISLAAAASSTTDGHAVRKRLSSTGQNAPESYSKNGPSRSFSSAALNNTNIQQQQQQTQHHPQTAVTNTINLAAMTQKDVRAIPPTASALSLKALAQQQQQPNQRSSNNNLAPSSTTPPPSSLQQSANNQSTKSNLEMQGNQRQQHRQNNDSNDTAKIVIAAGAGAVLALVLNRLLTSLSSS